MAALSSYFGLPDHDGLLPKWLLFVGSVATLNAFQAYRSPLYTARVYLGTKSHLNPESTVPSVGALGSRAFGTWTLTSGIIRFIAAYNLENPVAYQLAFASYIIALAHFGSEWFYYGTAKMGPGILGPLIISSSTLVWMWLQWDYYVT
ncbi:putative ergosterol biosynthesis protein Erg28 [Patellaria atrata CBS 101060]|uniref:Ergosterol biosynthesis protein Erg28 n=1 Tax=Patellaria atrata CBS 101060 TaxID=1346257 RepID=A0A9P4S4I0_9PEZI|nr:putative ergosterol biosynthesis protein Erg28 [Patellaria atrata CBS 101060]